MARSAESAAASGGRDTRLTLRYLNPCNFFRNHAENPLAPPVPSD